MRDFNKVSPTLWRSNRFVGLPSDDGRLLYLYLLTCPHQNSAGCFWLPDGYVCNDLAWDRDRYIKARQRLIDADLIGFDGNEQVVFIRRWFRHNPPMNPSHVTGIEKALMQCPSIDLRDKCHEELKAAWAEKVASSGKGKPSAQKPSGNGYAR
jgi:hypothetical protein